MLPLKQQYLQKGKTSLQIFRNMIFCMDKKYFYHWENDLGSSVPFAPSSLISADSPGKLLFFPKKYHS